MLIEDQKKKLNLFKSIPVFQTFIILCLIVLLIYFVIETVTGGASLPAFLERRLVVPGLDDGGASVSALLIGMVSAAVLFFYTIYSIGSQKKARRMKARPVNQLVFTIIADILIVVISVLYMKNGGYPLLAGYLLIAILLFAVLSGASGARQKENVK